MSNISKYKTTFTISSSTLVLPLLDSNLIDDILIPYSTQARDQEAITSSLISIQSTSKG
jgi:hypothetical protein